MSKAAMTYRAKNGSRITDAQAARWGRELHRLGIMGFDPPEEQIDAVIEAAKDPASPMHDMNDWDVHRAARARWREHTRYCIASIECVIIKAECQTKVGVRALISIPASITGSGNERQYHEIQAVVECNDLLARAILAEVVELRASARKLAAFDALGKIALAPGLQQLNRAIVAIELAARDAIGPVEESA